MMSGQRDGDRGVPDSGESVVRTYTIPPLDRSGLLFGFGFGELVLLGVATGACFALLQVGAPMWVYGPLMATSVVAARRRWPGGLQLLEYLPILRCRWERVTTGGEWRARAPWSGGSGGDRPRPLAGIELVSVCPAGFGEVGVVVDHLTASATFVVELGASSFLLASEREQVAVLDRWGRMLGAAVEAGNTGVRHVSCTLISSQGSPRDHLAYVDRAAGAVAASRAAHEYGQLVRRGTAATSSHRILFSVTVAGRASRAGGWGLDEPVGASRRAGIGRSPGAVRELQFREVARTVVSTMHDLRSLGWSEQRPLTEAELWALVGESVDPSTRLGRAAQADRGISALLSGGGPAGPPTSVVEHREYVVVNGVAHRSYWVRTWPNYGLRPDWMIRFLSEVDGERRLTAFFRPVPRSESVKAYERDMARHDSATITAAEKGKRVSLATRSAQRSMVDLGEDLMAGYPEVELCAVATISATDPRALRRRCDAFESLATASGIQLSPLRDAQELGWRDSTPFGFCPIKPRTAWS